MKTEPTDDADQPNGHIDKDASTPPHPSSSLPPTPSAPSLTPAQSSSPSNPPATPSTERSQPSSQASSQRECEQFNETNQNEKLTEQPFLERNKLDKLFHCLRKVGSAIQELVEENSGSTFSSSSYSVPFESKEEVPPSNPHLPHSRVTKDFGCQKYGSVSFVHRSVGDRSPLIRSMEEFESLEPTDQRRYLISQLDTYGKQYLKIIEDKERRRRKLCHLQSEFISLMLPQFSIIHSIMAEGLRNEWQNKLKIIDELTRTLSDYDDRLNLTNDVCYSGDQSSSGINLSISHQRQQQRKMNNGETENDEEYENEEEETGNEFDEVPRTHHDNYSNGNLSDPSHQEVLPSEDINSSAEYLRLATERFAQLTRRNFEESPEEGLGVPVDLTTDSDFVNQFVKFQDSVSKRQYSRKSLPPTTKYINIGNNNSYNGCSDPASPKPPGLHKYKICLFRDGLYRCYYIGKDRSCNMRQHWLHRHGVDTPPEHFYARKDLTDEEVQKYKLKYEVQKSNYPKNRDPLMSTLFHQQSPAKKAKLSPTQQENSPQT